MRKHYKLISSIVCLVLCACMIAFGVYAATAGLSFNVSSQVSFTPTSAKLKIFGGIANIANATADEGASLTYYACNYGAGKKNYAASKTDSNADVFNTWNYGKIKFADYNESDGKPKPIYFYIQITNYVERNVKYSIDLDESSTSILSCVDITYGYYLKENTDDELKGTSATSNGWWDIDGIEASAPNFHSSTSTTQNPNYNPKFDDKFSFYNKDNFEQSLQEAKTSLSTIMLIVKLDLKDTQVDDSFDSAGFMFTVTAK